jgi:tetratricopeptide (TPR) repeat protein
MRGVDKCICPQKIIEQFRENYQTNDALSWYTRDCFLYRLLNKAFRSENIARIFQFRFFLTDIHNQLEKLHMEYIKSIPTNQNTLIFYRGQALGNEELQKLTKNIGKMISINTYLSTTTNSQVALMFAGNGKQRPFIESVLFQIEIDCSLMKSSKPFANIGHVSFLKDENEVLLSPGMVFLIEFIEQYDYLWHVQLKLVSEEKTTQLTKITEFSRKEGAHESPLISLGYFLWKTGEYDKAKIFYSMILKEQSSSNYVLPSLVYNNIGLLYNDQGRYKEALKYYRKSVKYDLKKSVDQIMLI